MSGPAAEIAFWGRTPAGAAIVHEIHGAIAAPLRGASAPWIEIDGVPRPVDAHHCGDGAFAAVFAAPPQAAIAIAAHTPAGGAAREALTAPPATAAADLRARGAGANTVIVLAVYNPKPALFARQIASLRAQTANDWSALVLDGGSDREGQRVIAATIGADARFECLRLERNLGAPGNFAAALAAAPPSRFIALADADDVWRPDKIARTRDALRQSGALLAYCDMRIVRENGAVIAESFWTRRSNQWRDIAGMLIANTVTSAASVIDPSLLHVALPPPQTFAKTFHDQWLAVCALAMGEIAYVDAPLYDYVQHEGQDIGYRTARGPAWARDLRNLARAGEAIVRRSVNAPPSVPAWRALTEEALRIKHLALALRLRCAEIADDRRAQALSQFAGLPRDQAARALLFSRGLARFGRRSDTLGRDWRLLAAALAAP